MVKHLASHGLMSCQQVPAEGGGVLSFLRNCLFVGVLHWLKRRMHFLLLVSSTLLRRGGCRISEAAYFQVICVHHCDRLSANKLPIHQHHSSVAQVTFPLWPGNYPENPACSHIFFSIFLNHFFLATAWLYFKLLASLHTGLL